MLPSDAAGPADVTQTPFPTRAPVVGVVGERPGSRENGGVGEGGKLLGRPRLGVTLHATKLPGHSYRSSASDTWDV